MEDIRRQLPVIEGDRDARDPRRCPLAADAAPSSGIMTPLQAELLAEGVVPEPDEIGASLRRADIAPEAGYDEDGPAQSPSPEALAAQDRYEGWPSVFQWEINPADPSLESGESHLTMDDWDYDIWWQLHPVGLLYASIQALRDDPAAGPERQHPVGRNVVVNLVYDQRRAGVVAIYGTARDFRPFVEAFRIACNIERQSEEKNS